MGDCVWGGDEGFYGIDFACVDFCKRDLCNVWDGCACVDEVSSNAVSCEVADGFEAAVFYGGFD